MVKTGTGIRKARGLCLTIQLVLSRPDIYIQHHHKIVEAVETVHPVHEVHSIDEMSIKLRGPDRDPIVARRFAMEMKAAIRARVGEWMRCSIGIAPNAMLAKTAGEMVKPDGIVYIGHDELPDRLYSLEMTDLPGINHGIHAQLRSHGIYTMPHLCGASKRRLREAWGSILGETWWEWLHGHDPWVKPAKRKNIGHQHVLAPDLRPRESARAVEIRLLMKAATRLRAEKYWCTKLTLQVRPMDEPSWSIYQNLEPCQCTVRLLHHLDALWEQRSAEFIFCVGVPLSGLVRDGCVERQLFDQDRKTTELAHTMDAINSKHGHAKVYFGSMHHALCAVENVRRGTPGIDDGKKVMPVELDRVERTKPLLPKQIVAVIDLQILTGAREGELLIMRPGDIDRDRVDGVWIYTPATHKRHHAGESKEICIGPRAQRVLIPFLNRRDDQFMFSPAEAEADRRGKPAGRLNAPGDRYTTQSYGRAIKRACTMAFPFPLCMKLDQRDQWERANRWTPHRIRHTASTMIRAQYGLEASQLMLGHSSAMVTDAVYAERDLSKVVAIAYAVRLLRRMPR